MSGITSIGGLELTNNRLIIIFFTIFVFFAVIYILKKTVFGLHMRAVTQNRKMASAMGINTKKIDMLTFAFGSGVAGDSWCSIKSNYKCRSKFRTELYC